MNLMTADIPRLSPAFALVCYRGLARVDRRDIHCVGHPCPASPHAAMGRSGVSMAHDPSSEAESTERLSIFRLIGILTRLMRPYWRRGMLVGLSLLCEMAFA